MSCVLQGLLLVCEVIELVALGENQQVLFQSARMRRPCCYFTLLAKKCVSLPSDS